MDNTFKCGLIRAFPSSEDPNWAEFAERLGFAQRMGLNAVFMTAFTNSEGDWVVPFYCLEDSMGRFPKADRIISQSTPYNIVGMRMIDLPSVSLETMRSLSSLLPEPAGYVKVADIEPPARRSSLVRPEQVFDGLVGMDSQKEQLVKLSLAVSKHGKGAVDCFHFIFTGPPGTGKTELATRLPHFFDLLGITDGTARLVKAGEADLVAKYVGHTAPKVRGVVESALGGVLFIDEFYAIASAPHFGQECVDALVDQLDAHRHDLVCVVAGYPDEIDGTLDMNPGLRDRFGYCIDFPGYTEEDLSKIFVSMAEGRGFSVESGKALSECTRKLRHSRGFSNARTMRKLVDHAIVEASAVRDEAKIIDRDILLATEQVYTGERTRRAGF